MTAPTNTDKAAKPATDKAAQGAEPFADRGILGPRWIAEQIARAEAKDAMARLKARR